MENALKDHPRKGRGAIGNPAGRFTTEQTVRVDDGWYSDVEKRRIDTTVSDEQCRSIITRNASPDISFDRSINPYRGCEHGCIYCYARPSHACIGLSPGMDFETKLSAKVNAAEVLERELRRPGYRPRTVMLGANTDPYQPLERKRRITRAILKVLADFRHPVAIATKSAMVTRDIDILKRLAEKRLISVGVSVTTLEPELARRMEPRASSPQRRLDAIRRLSDAGIPVTVLSAPMIPFLNDHELEAILTAAAEAGATGASYILLRLPFEVKDLFSDWLSSHYPLAAKRVLGRLRDCRDGNLYVADWGARMTGHGTYAEMIAKRFEVACQRLDLAIGATATRALDHTRFAPPPKPGEQLSLL